MELILNLIISFYYFLFITFFSIIFGETPLNVAVQLNSSALVQSLLDNKANTNLANLDQKKLEEIKGKGKDQPSYKPPISTPFPKAITPNTGRRPNTVTKGALFRNTSSNSILQLNEATEAYHALGAGDIGRLGEIINNGLNLNTQFFDNETLLHRAIIYHNVEAAKLLIDSGCSVDARTLNFQDSPLHMAISENQNEILQMLLDKGANIENTNFDGETPLFSAIRNGNFSAAEALINKKADVNVVNKGGNTPIQISIMLHQEDIAKLLIKNNADFRKGEGNSFKIAQQANELDLANEVRSKVPDLAKELTPDEFDALEPLEEPLPVPESDKLPFVSTKISTDDLPKPFEKQPEPEKPKSPPPKPKTPSPPPKPKTPSPPPKPASPPPKPKTPSPPPKPKTPSPPPKPASPPPKPKTPSPPPKPKTPSPPPKPASPPPKPKTPSPPPKPKTPSPPPKPASPPPKPKSPSPPPKPKTPPKQEEKPQTPPPQPKPQPQQPPKLISQPPVSLSSTQPVANTMNSPKEPIRKPLAKVDTSADLQQLFQIIKSKNIPILKSILSKRLDLNVVDNAGRVPLLFAIEYSTLDAIKLITAAGADIDFNDKESPIHTAIRLKKMDVIDYLIECGCDVNALNKDEENPLYNAIRISDLKIVQKLVTKGTKINVVNINNMSPLYLAVGRRNIPIVKYLLNNHADPNDTGLPCLKLAQDSKDNQMANILIGAGAKTQARRQHKSRMQMLSLSRTRPAPRAQSKIDTDTCIICGGNTNIMKLIPCCHQVVCRKCVDTFADKFTSCPICCMGFYATAPK